MKSVKSIRSCKSLPGRQAGVIQTIYDIVKTPGEELIVETIELEGTTFIIKLPITPTQP